MLRRCGTMIALALLVGSTGCTGPMMRGETPLAFGSKAWSDTSAPPQTQVRLPPERDDTSVVSNTPSGLARYFPGLRHASTDQPKTVSSPRTSWFSMARRQKPSQEYATDARSGGLNPSPANVAALPVALDVPSDRAADLAVTPTVGLKASDLPDDLLAPSNAKPAIPSSPRADLRSPTGYSSRPMDDEVNPLPPAAEPELEVKPAVSARMPEMPAIDPRERPRLAIPSTTDRPVEPTTPLPKADDQAVNAAPATSDSSTIVNPTTLAAFLHRKSTTDPNKPHVHASSTVLATPQSEPKPAPAVVTKILPTPQVVSKTLPKPSPQVVTKTLPTPQAPPKPSPQVVTKVPPKPTPQVLPTSQVAAPVAKNHQECVCENCGAKVGKRPCVLKRIRKAIFDPDSVIFD